MKFSKAWIEEWVETGMTADELSDVITMAGLEVDTVEKAAGDFDHVVVGQVVECADHPDSDHLHVTKVDVGSGELLDIVCGAPNCRKGLKVCVAMTGAVLPGDFKIKPARLRGVPSNGMLCSYRELGVELPSEGIIELPADAPLGQDVRSYFGWDDALIEVDLTANRADCLSIIGLAREIAVLSGKKYTLPEFTRAVPSVSDTVSITLDDPKACPRYFGRIFKGLNVRAETPVWMKEKLRRCGLRSVDPIVDVTNYVMLELGQPLHSFDLNRLKGGIHVRFARQGEKLKVLSGEELELRPSTLVIADDTGPVAMAGIYGGLDTGVSENTTDILLECAYFSPDAIKGEAREYGLATDASHRNERGIDWNIQELACERATQLLLDICGGRCSEIIRAEDQNSLPVSKSIRFDMSLVHRVIGENIVTEEQVLNILNSLGIKTESLGDGRMKSESPSWRIDIAVAEDLIEEVARIYGYNRIPNAAPKAELNMLRSSMTELSPDRLKSLLVCRNYNEVVTYSFVDQEKMAVMFPDIKPLVIPKPITADMDAMRVSLLPGLMQVVAFNNSRQQTSLKIFESGLRFIPDETAPNGIAQIKTLSGAISGLAHTEQWAVAGRNVDFFDIKGDVEALLELTGRRDRFTFAPYQCSALHPGQSAAVLYEGKQVGILGQIHPTVQKKYGVKFKTFVFEIDLSALSTTEVPVYHEISKFPSNRRDIAIVIDNSVPVGDIIDSIRTVSSDPIRSVSLFDLYSGGTLDEGKKSIAISLQLQDLNSTLDEARISETVNRVLDLLKDKFNAVLRD